MAELTNRIIASFYGLAFGDALGHPLSTLSYEELICDFPGGLDALEFEPGLKKYAVGDDTQMALFTSLGMRNSISSETYRKDITQYLTFWFDDPQCNRHASQHTLKALEKHKKGIHWTAATNLSLNRCDVLARGAAIAYWMARDSECSQYWNLSFLQASITHSHPTALVASALFTESLIWLLKKNSVQQLPAHLLMSLTAMEQCWLEKYVENLWQLPGFSSPAEFLRKGIKKCRKKIEMVIRNVQHAEYADLDPSALFGEGWTADEALAIAIYCFLQHCDSPEHAVKRAVLSNGPSDTLGALTGALAGAWNGSEGWPSDWYTRIEYKEEIMEMSRIIGRGAVI